MPNKQQTLLLNKWEGHSRWLWNYFLDLNQKEYASNKKFIWRYDLDSKIPELKKTNEWLREAPSQSLQQISLSMDTALKGLKSGKGFPKFKKKNVSNGQILIKNSPQQIFTSKTHIKLPKIGDVKWIQHRELPQGKIKQAQITRDLDKWFVSVLVEVADAEPILIDQNKVVGIDLGISSFAILSDGTKISSPTFLKKKLKYLKKYQRQLAKKKLGSANRKKAAVKVARIHREIRNQRADWLHKTSNDLTKNYDLICLEDLKIKSLMKGKKQRSLNRAISDQGWGMFVTQIKYKQARLGHHTTQIDQWAPSSKTCSSCGYKMSKMALDIRNWTCPSCGADHDRDLNAALNIKFWGIMATDHALFNSISTGGTPGINACGDTSTQNVLAYDNTSEVSLNQEAACPLGLR
jgi:putative transposase